MCEEPVGWQGRGSTCFLLLNGGDSATSYRRRRNGASRFGSKRGKRWAAAVSFPATVRFFRRPSFSPFSAQRCAPFRRERSERAESPTESRENTSDSATKKLAKLEYRLKLEQNRTNMRKA